MAATGVIAPARMVTPRRSVPPSDPGDWVARPELLAVLDGALGRRLTTVVAGPGCGKTTLLASWARTKPCAWYTLTSADGDLPVLARGLSDALRVRLPGLLDPLVRFDDPADVAVGLADELERECGTDLVLVVDDVGELGAGTPSMRLLQTLCRQAPPVLHLVLSSRTRLPLSIERLRGRGQVLELDGAMLAFTAAETADVVTRMLGHGEPGVLAGQLHEITQGWPAATRLAVEWLRHRRPAERGQALTELARPGGPLFGYLAEEVCPPDDPTLRALLPVVAPLPRFGVELCAALGIRVDAVELTGCGPFVRRDPDRQGWFMLAPLIRDFAVARAAPDVLRRAMDWFTAGGHLVDALRCALALGEPDRIAGFLADHGRALLGRVAVADVLAAASELPVRLRSEPIERLDAEARLVHGDWNGTLGANPPAWLICRVHEARGELDEAVAMLDGTTDDQALLLSCAAGAALRRGLDRCRGLAERALVAAGSDDRALAAAHTALLMIASADGDPGGVEAHADAAVAAARRSRDVLAEIPIAIHRAADRIDRGAYAQALRELDTALELAERAGDAVGLAHGRYRRGTAHLGLGRLDVAIGDLEVSRTAYQRLESRDVARPLLGLAQAYRERGDATQARSRYAEAVAWAERSGDVAVLAAALAGLAGALAVEDPPRAAALARRALKCAPSTGRVAALLAAGRVALDGGAIEQAGRWAAEAIEVAGARRDRAGLAEALELRAAADPDHTTQLPAMREAAGIWAELGNSVASARNAAARARTPVHDSVEVRTLGGFSVLRDGRAVRAPEWNSKKARDLLKLLISRRGRPTPREVLIETIWPEEDPVRCANRLSVALSKVRAVLDPGHRYAPDHFVPTDKHIVGLTNLRVDVVEFLAAASGIAGRNVRREELRAVEACYTGDFLEEDLYEDWTVSLREQARAAYLVVARALARAAGEAGDDEEAVRCHLRVLERDPYDEEAHLGRTVVLAAAGRHGQARACYRSYVARMAELDIEPAPFPDVKPIHRRGETVTAWRRS